MSEFTDKCDRFITLNILMNFSQYMNKVKCYTIFLEKGGRNMDKIPLPALWLIIAVVLGVIEASSLNLITLWFAIGAVAAMISALFGIPFIYQVVIFIMVSALLLYFTKPLIKKFLYVRKEKTNADRIIGDKGIVVERIDPVNGTGQVKIGGQIWTARSTDDEVIELGELVDVQDISGVKVFVKKSSDINKNEKQ